MGVRGDAIAQFDWSVGRIMHTLDSLGIADNTMIILSSDNGPIVDDGYDDRAEELLNGHMPAGPFRGNKYSAFEGGTMVPVIVSWPAAMKGGKKSNLLMTQVDWLASLAQLVDARIPSGAAPDSRSCLGNMLGYDTTPAPWVIEMASNRTLSVRTQKWKYIEPNDGPEMITWGPKVETGNRPTPQLYDMEASLDEQKNLALERPEVVFEMQNILRRAKQK